MRSSDASRSVARSAEFNATVLNHPDVRYFSYSAAAAIPFYSPYYPSYRVIQRVEGENDGLVSVSSAMWGTCRCELTGSLV